VKILHIVWWGILFWATLYLSRDNDLIKQLLAICRPSDRNVASGVVIVSERTCLIFGMSITLDPS